MTPSEDFVVTDRGGIVENRHRVHAAVVDATGRLLYALGNPERMTLARSAAKPAQALAILETEGFAGYGFDDADIALMCASHSSEERHIARTRTMLSKIKAEEADLRCGGHPSLSETVNRSWIKQDFVPTGVCSNCSGKHVGMLAGARAIGAGMEGYHLPDHPMQGRVKRTVAELCDLDVEDVEWGVDGCNLPTPAFPLDRLARIYAKLAAVADGYEAGKGLSTRGPALARIFHAMARHPDMVAGEGRYCTALMRAYNGALIGKLGADASYAIGVRASDETRRLGTDGALGISVKIEDGNLEILYAVVTELLQRLGIGSADILSRLAPFHHPQRVNTMGVTTGGVSFPFKLRGSEADGDDPRLAAPAG
ncbi:MULTISPECIES: asparaginase [unclassified Rhizobium]|uniref:asparaginase n=1 Tax=unclassified Rhizobium TaxID=2613769 RepID=UPI0007E965A1|nr:MULTISPECIES: asparaginase [unclassified Rhizobium]ANM14167.1 L-asparaginase 2 family protein [Rhizobium sp. N324]ANM20549.1 L-asparaginase 2 family protein [Rhizobium sp. N541]ANM26933.1 L-asparaginase 2 family protein [Rhizobium sp. N941]OYD00340.1 L-asparaginase 2 family protein [Rhizobium sp. N4311]